MEEKKIIKINLSTFFLILAIIVIVVMGIFIYKLYNEKVEATKKSAELQKQVNDVTDISFTEEQIKTTLSDFLELQANANCDALLECLTEKGKLNYNSSKDNILDNGLVITTIKFSDYKRAMLNYVSESEFERNWNSTRFFEENSNGYLTKSQGGGAFTTYTINNIKKIGDLTYIANTTSNTEGEHISNVNYKFILKNVNNKCVVDSCE